MKKVNFLIMGVTTTRDNAKLTSSTADEIQIVQVCDFRQLVSEETYRRMTARVAKDKGYDQVKSELCIDSAIGFLYLCATNEGPFAPSRFVDDGWHTFLLYTHEYFEFCNRFAGSYIHHSPNDRVKSIDSKHQDGDKPLIGVRHTIDAMVQSNIPIDLSAWLDFANQNSNDCDDRPCEPQRDPCSDRCQADCVDIETPEDGNNTSIVRMRAKPLTKQQRLVVVASSNTTCDCDSGNGPDFNCTCS